MHMEHYLKNTQVKPCFDSFDLDNYYYQQPTENWMADGERHKNDDQPAVVMPNGSQYWYQHGKRHRDGDQPAHYGGLFKNKTRETLF